MNELKIFDKAGLRRHQREMERYKVVPAIKAEGYPVSVEGYKEAHREANKHERKTVGSRRFKTLQKVIEKKIPVGELAGSHTKTGQIIVSDKIPEKYHEQIVFHEQKEHRIMSRKQRKRKSRIRRTRS